MFDETDIAGILVTAGKPLTSEEIFAEYPKHPFRRNVIVNDPNDEEWKAGQIKLIEQAAVNHPNLFKVLDDGKIAWAKWNPYTYVSESATDITIWAIERWIADELLAMVVGTHYSSYKLLTSDSK